MPKIILNIFFLCALIFLASTLTGCFGPSEFTSKLPSKNVDLNKYLGTWYEIARMPTWFEKDLVGVTATYSLKQNGKIEVLNQGLKNTLNGERKKAIGEAWIPDMNKTGRLKVSFFWPFAADYIVLELDENYQYALVGSDKDYLWILSRTPELKNEIYEKLLKIAADLKFDTIKLIKVQQK